MSSTANRVIKNTGFLYVKMGITMFISLYTTRLILNSLGASDFGIFNIVGGAISMLGFLNAAMASATQRFMSYSEGEGNKEKQKTIFNVSFVLHFVISLIVGLALLIAGYFFFNGILNIPEDRIFAAKIVYCSLIVSTMFTVMTVPYDAAMNAHENMKYYAIVGVFESLLRLSVAFVCVYTNHDKLIVYGALMACIPLITLSIMRIYCHNHYEECIVAPKKYWNKSLMNEMTSFAGWNLMTSLTSILTQQGLNIIINIYFGVLLNAAQGIANQVSGVVLTFTHNISKAVNPVLVKYAGAHNTIKVNYISFLSCRLQYAAMAIFALPLIMEMDNILTLWLDKVPDWATLFCKLQLIRLLLECIGAGLGTGISARGKIKWLTISKSFFYIIPLILLPLFFYLGYPPYTMYIVWIICWSIIGNILLLYFYTKYIKVHISQYLNSVLYPIFLTTAIYILSYYFIYFISEFCKIDMFLIRIIISTLLFLITIWFFLLKNNERKQLIFFIKNKNI